MKLSGKDIPYFEGPAVVFDTEFAAYEAIVAGDIKAGDVLIIRYEGPKGSPGMPEMLSPGAALVGAGLGKEVALITDGRFSGASHGICFLLINVCTVFAYVDFDVYLLSSFVLNFFTWLLHSLPLIRLRIWQNAIA